MRAALWLVLIVALMLIGINVFMSGDGCKSGTDGTIRTVTRDSVRVTGVADTAVKVLSKSGRGKKVKEPVINYRALSDSVKLDIRVEDEADSVVISYDMEYPQYAISRVDTIQVTVRDSSVSVREEAWYEDGWFLGGMAALMVSVILLFIN